MGIEELLEKYKKKKETAYKKFQDFDDICNENERCYYTVDYGKLNELEYKYHKLCGIVKGLDLAQKELEEKK